SPVSPFSEPADRSGSRRPSRWPNSSPAGDEESDRYPSASAWLTSWLTSVATAKSSVSRFLVRAKAIPVAVSAQAKPPPTPPTPNAVGESCGVDPSSPTEYPSAHADGIPKTSSTPLMDSAVASRSRVGGSSRTPSPSPSSAAYHTEKALG